MFSFGFDASEFSWISGSFDLKDEKPVKKLFWRSVWASNFLWIIKFFMLFFVFCLFKFRILAH